LNAHIEVPVPLHRDQAHVHECFHVVVRTTLFDSGVASRLNLVEEKPCFRGAKITRSSGRVSSELCGTRKITSIKWRQ
jgi:hypothetical protein